MLYDVSVSIDAPREEVWQILTDVSHWQEWEPNVVKIDGEVAVGELLTVHTRLSERAFPAKVTVLDGPKRMVWSWSLPFGMFKGERVFELTDTREGCEVYCGEEFSGWLLPVFGKTVPDLSHSFLEFGAGLKLKAEGLGSLSGYLEPEAAEPGSPA